MTLVEKPPSAPESRETQVLFPEAHRRRRRRWVIGALVVVAAVLGPTLGLQGGGTPGSHGRTPRPIAPQRSPAPEISGNRVVVVDNDAAMTLIEFSTGAQKAVVLPHKTGGDYPDALLATGGFFVYPGNGGTWAVAVDLSGRPRLLGPSSDVVPSATSGRVWLVTTTTATGRPVPTTVREVAVDGRYRSAIHRVPTGFSPISGVTGGLLLIDTSGPGGGSVIWSPTTGRFGPHLPGPDVGNLVDVRASMVAWGVGCNYESICTSLRVIDVRTGRSRDYPAPAGTAGWVSTGGEGSRDAFSPDGDDLALRAANGKGQPVGSDVYVVDLSSGATSVVPDSSASVPYSRVAWVPDSSWVISASAAGSVSAYNVRDGQRRAFPTACCGVALLSVAG